MVFENNWDFSLSYLAVDPSLHVSMRYYGTRGTEEHRDDAEFAIFYNPNIVPENYFRPLTLEELENRNEMIQRGSLNKNSPALEPNFDTYEGELGAGFSAKRNLVGDVLRIKTMPALPPKYPDNGELHGIDSWRLKFEVIKLANYPIVSEHPTDFLLYAFKNLITIPASYSVESTEKETRYRQVPMPGARRVEICMHKPVLSQIFMRSPSDYPEVEPDWHCLASQELGA